MLIEPIELKNGTAVGLKMDMEHAPLLVIKAPKGFVMCGYLNIDTAQRLGDVAVKVTGVGSFDDVLAASVVESTTAAQNIGIQEGMTGQAALELMF